LDKIYRKVIKFSLNIKDMAEQYEGFCVKCKKKVIIKDPQIVELKNGRKAVKGVCPHCGTTIYRFIGSS